MVNFSFFFTQYLAMQGTFTFTLAKATVMMTDGLKLTEQIIKL